jgi:hypothetical protein
MIQKAEKKFSIGTFTPNFLDSVDCPFSLRHTISAGELFPENWASPDAGPTTDSGAVFGIRSIPPSMLRPNPLQPPRPFLPPAESGPASQARAGFISADDFDRTGILTGVDPCESRYWWLPELSVAEEPVRQATSRSRPKPPAAA